MKKGKRIEKATVVIMLLLLMTGCATTPRTYEGAGVGGAVGATLGAILNKGNPWKGGVIGGAIGALAGGALVELSTQAAVQAAQTNRSVTYRANNGYVVQATPINGYSQRTDCKKVQERVWRYGELVKEEVKEVCKGRKRTSSY